MTQPDGETEVLSGSAPAAWVQTPRVHRLTQRQIECVLSRNHVGRVAFLSANGLEIRPVHFVYYAGALYGRTTFETNGVTWLMRPEVVVEVDEVRDLYEWRSVIVRGRVSLLLADGSPAERSAYWAGVDAIRNLVPDAFTERDPTPYLNVAFRVDAREMTGREAGLHSRLAHDAKS
jgi:nitroimidazol reductase NimA-like FMN-containing flavoprotein (pyridoxamine 5'-phosphate oxidase superfamily)